MFCQTLANSKVETLKNITNEIRIAVGLLHHPKDLTFCLLDYFIYKVQVLCKKKH